MAFLKSPRRGRAGCRGRNDSLFGYRNYDAKMLEKAPLLYLPQNEGMGTTMTAYVRGVRTPTWDGLYTGVTWGLGTFVDGSPAPWHDGAGDNGNFLTVPAAAAFNGKRGTWGHWVRVHPGVWTDGIFRYFSLIKANNDNQMYIAKNAGNSFVVTYRSGGVWATNGNTETPADWFHALVTWDETAGEVKHYYQGQQILPTRAPGVWAGVPATMMLGWTQHGFTGPGVLDDRVWSAAEVLEAAAVP